MALPALLFLPGGMALIGVDGEIVINAADCCCGAPCIECTQGDCTFCLDTLVDYHYYSKIVTVTAGGALTIVVEQWVDAVGIALAGGDSGQCGDFVGLCTAHNKQTNNGVVVSDTTSTESFSAGVSGTLWGVKVAGFNFDSIPGDCAGGHRETHTSTPPNSFDEVSDLVAYRP